MDDIIVRLARTLACEERLRILAAVIARPKVAPTVLARRLKLSPNALSAHLAKLAQVGLITRQRSGPWSYCVAKSPYNAATLSGMTLAWLRKELPAARPGLHKNIFDAATAFTDLRRLQILRSLRQQREVDAPTFCERLRMSPWAFARHSSKLIRRGYLMSRTAEDAVAYRLSDAAKTPIHAALWQIVCSTWDQS